MITFLIILPWALTLGALLFIMMRDKYEEYDEDEDDGDYEDDMEDNESIRVAVYDDKAYWVHNNVFYESEITREPDFETARPIDIMSMSNREIKKLLVILDEIEESGKE